MTNKITLGFIPFLLAALVFTGSSATATVGEEKLELQMREIAKTLRCTVCQNESIWESQAELAFQMRDVIRDRLRKGENPEQIRAYFLSRYGDYILLAPQKKGFNWILWAGPFVMLAVGGTALFIFLSRWVTRTSRQPQENPPPMNEELRRRIEKELQSREE